MNIKKELIGWNQKKIEMRTLFILIFQIIFMLIIKEKEEKGVKLPIDINVILKIAIKNIQLKVV